jgi:hypothetical protein
MKKIFLIFITVSLISSFLNAQDFLAGNISLRHVGIDSIEASVNIYTDANSSIDRSETLIFWGDGLKDTVTRTSLTNINNEINHHKYIAIHKYLPIITPGGYATIRIEEQYISNAIANWNDSAKYTIVATQFVVPIGISPSINSQYTTFGTMTNGITNVEGKFIMPLNTSSFDSLYYIIGYDTTSISYSLPDNLNNFSIDNTTQTLVWNKPTQIGKYIMFIQVQQQWFNSYTSFAILLDVKNIITNTIQQPKINFNLHPNPTSETLQITTETPVDEIQIYNSIGQQVWQGQGFRENQVRVNVRDFSEGMYIVRVRQGESWVSEQVLVIRN